MTAAEAMSSTAVPSDHTDALDVFDDASYEKEVLGLPDGESEDDLDRRVLAEAKQFDLARSVAPDAIDGVPSPTSTTASDDPLRSASVETNASPSTHRNSTLSDSSRELDPPATACSHNGRSRWQLSRHSMSMQDYNRVTERLWKLNRSSTQLRSPLEPANLPPISTDYNPKRFLSRIGGIRGLSKLKRNRKNYSCQVICLSCKPDRRKIPLYRLPCGHTYCVHTLSKIITNFPGGDFPQSNPTCCGFPISSDLVQQLVGQESDSVSSHNLDHWIEPRRNSMAKDPTVGIRCDLPIYHVAESYVKSDGYFAESNTRASQSPDDDADWNLARALDMPDFREMRVRQEEERDRFLEYRSKRRKVLSDQHQERRQQDFDRQQRELEELDEKHLQFLSTVEDRHVAKEFEMRKSHEAAARACDLALRHMEAYCRTATPSSASVSLAPPSPSHSSFNTDSLSSASSTPYPNSQPTNNLSRPLLENRAATSSFLSASSFERSMEFSSDEPGAQVPFHVVTEQDLRELAKQRWVSDDMSRKHESEINVLRGNQTQKMNAHRKRQKKEVESMWQKHERESDDLESILSTESSALEKAFEEKRRRMQARWKTTEDCWRSALESDTGVIINGELRGVSWPDFNLGEERRASPGSQVTFNLPKSPPSHLPHGAGEVFPPEEILGPLAFEATHKPLDGLRRKPVPPPPPTASQTALQAA